MNELRILIADDSKFMRKLIRKIIEGLGHRVIGEASNGEELISLLESIKPDIIFLDINMPEMDGLKALKYIRQKVPEAKVIIVSALAQDSVIEEAKKLGALHFISKPFTVNKFREAIEIAAKG